MLHKESNFCWVAKQIERFIFNISQINFFKVTSDVLHAFSTVKLDERSNRSKRGEADVPLNIDVNEILNGRKCPKIFHKIFDKSKFSRTSFRRLLLHELDSAAVSYYVPVP